MAVPSFIPLIGDSFGDLGRQQAQWAGFNSNVDAQNIQRAAQAQEVQNRWLQQAAQAQVDAQNRDLATQFRADNLARSDAAQQRQEAEQARQFGIGVALDKERVAAENTRTATQAKTEQLATDLAQHAANQKIENVGQTSANNYFVAKHIFDTASAHHEDLQRQLEETQAAAEAEGAKPKAAWYNRKEGHQDPARLTNLLGKVKDLKAELKLSEKILGAADTKFQKARNVPSGFEIDEETGQVKHLDSDKTWSFKGALAQAAAATQGDVPRGSDISDQSLANWGDWASKQLPMTTPDPPVTGWAGLTQASPTAAGAPMIAPVSGRMIVRGPDGKLVYQTQ